MTALSIINTAMAARGMQPLTFSCPCCGDTLDREDRAQPGQFTTETAMLNRWGGLPCFACADEVVECAECGRATFAGEYDHREENGNHFCGGRCLAEYDRRSE